MSIISDALKKAQQTQSAPLKDGKAAVEPLAPLVRHHTPQQKMLQSVISWGILLLVSGLVAFKLITETMGTLATPSVVTRYKIPDKIEIQAKSKEAVAPSTFPFTVPLKTFYSGPPEEAFSLSGIVQGAGKPVAIINDKVLEEGDSINDAKVIRIEDKKVTLSVKDKEVTLTLK